MADYPSPCLSCSPETQKTCNGKGCDRWVIRYKYRQKQINAYAKKVCGGFAYVKGEAWGYMHPDEYRAYLKSDPCANCLCKSWCDDPCVRYLAHFQAKMEYLKRRAESR